MADMRATVAFLFRKALMDSCLRADFAEHVGHAPPLPFLLTVFHSLFLGSIP